MVDATLQDDMVEAPMPSIAELRQLYDTIETSVSATSKAMQSLTEKSKDASHPDFDFANGLSLLLIRPHLLLASIHQLVIMLGLRLATSSSVPHDDEEEMPSIRPFSADRTERKSLANSSGEYVQASLQNELTVIREVMEKTKGLESKVSYQVKKLVTLANEAGMRETDAKKTEQEVDEDNAEGEFFGTIKLAPSADTALTDPLSFKPNPMALMQLSKKGKQAVVEEDKATARRAKNSRRSPSVSDDGGNGDAGDGIYRAPKMAAVPYVESRTSRRTDRRAPALLSEFASSLTSAPMLESTSGLAVRPVVTSGGDALHTNSKSAKRMAELQRMNEFEEENMTRLVMTKRELKKREEDEAALNMGYGVGGPSRSRSRRQGGFEAELEGVLGDRGGKSLWDGVGKGLGKRDGILERSRKRTTTGDEMDGGSTKRKKGKFEHAVKNKGRK
ncbi:hypothetical protein QFC22_000494 [Naganishia vaughanmartiniae]|uniref:Uncharacterized protein n=1 Tax=Naganishia vaughanmartiniae TaxID=1424756 RepID=A0ACC2XNW6_9TREE|nr:hypothetical protein QFC22_000494 [Naganishia vaughanmartiniae]